MTKVPVENYSSDQGDLSTRYEGVKAELKKKYNQ